MKTKSTIGRLITRLSEWRESGARVAAMLLLFCTTALPAWASTSWDTTGDDEGEGKSTYEYYTTSGSNVHITEKSGGKREDTKKST